MWVLLIQDKTRFSAERPISISLAKGTYETKAQTAVTTKTNIPINIIFSAIILITRLERGKMKFMYSRHVRLIL